MGDTEHVQAEFVETIIIALMAKYGDNFGKILDKLVRQNTLVSPIADDFMDSFLFDLSYEQQVDYIKLAGQEYGKYCV